MNALTLFTLSTSKGTGLPSMGMANGPADAEAEEGAPNSAFSALFDGLAMPIMTAPVIADANAGTAPPPIVNAGNNVPVPAPELPGAAPSPELVAAASVAAGDALFLESGKILPDDAASAPGVRLDGRGEVLQPPVTKMQIDTPFASQTPRQSYPGELNLGEKLASVASQKNPVPQHDATSGRETITAPDVNSDEPATGEARARDERPSPDRIFSLRNGGDMQVHLVLPAVVRADRTIPPPPIASRSAADGISAFEGSTRLDELVQAIAQARESGSNLPVRATISHAEFGALALRLAGDEHGVSAQIASADAGFAPAAHAALRAGDAGLSSQTRGDEQPRSHGNPQGQGQGQGQGQDLSQDQSQAHAQSSGQQRHAHYRPPSYAEAEAHSATHADKADASGPAQDRASGLYA